ncbi:MAG TPA: RICIN domain-containing protein [Verrucomicrobiae bacterium]|nr:RICIN domain-containing protein [Verrucomicrobiae bacterium]
MCAAMVHDVRGQTQPPNSLSITTYGASTGSADNTTDIQNCINAAQTQGKSVWVPAGTFQVKGSLNATGITIGGAGASSVIYRNQNSSDITATQLSLLSCTVENLMIDGNGTSRGVNASYGINIKGVGWLIENVTIHHSDAGIWASGTSGTIQSCLLTNTFADGANINNAGTDPNTAGANLTIQNCTQTGANDDGFAINAQGSGNMVHPQILNCTSLNDDGANGIRIAGGSNSVVSGCLVSNTVLECGIEASTFGSTGDPLVNGMIKNNVVYGCGTVDEASCIGTGDARTTATFTGNILNNSAGNGFQVGTPTYPNGGTIVFGPNNVINHPAKTGIYIVSGVSGSGKFYTNTVLNLASGQTQFTDASSSFSTTLTGNTWQGLGSGPYRIVNLNSGLALDATGQATTNGTPLEQWTYNAGANQLWNLTSLGSGQYTITGVQSGRVLDVKGQGTANGTAVQLYDSNGGSNQKWVISATAGTIQGVQSAKLMEVAGASKSPGALVDIYSSNGGANQQWSFQSP